MDLRNHKDEVLAYLQSERMEKAASRIREQAEKEMLESIMSDTGSEEKEANMSEDKVQQQILEQLNKFAFTPNPEAGGGAPPGGGAPMPPEGGDAPPSGPGGGAPPMPPEGGGAPPAGPGGGGGMPPMPPGGGGGMPPMEDMMAMIGGEGGGGMPPEGPPMEGGGGGEQMVELPVSVVQQMIEGSGGKSSDEGEDDKSEGEKEKDKKNEGEGGSSDSSSKQQGLPEGVAQEMTDMREQISALQTQVDEFSQLIAQLPQAIMGGAGAGGGMPPGAGGPEGGGMPPEGGGAGGGEGAAAEGQGAPEVPLSAAENPQERDLLSAIQGLESGQ